MRGDGPGASRRSVGGLTGGTAQATVGQTPGESDMPEITIITDRVSTVDGVVDPGRGTFLVDRR